MCIIITAPLGNVIPEDHLKNGFEGNPDGAGIAVAIDGKLIIEKFLTYDSFIKYYRTVAGLGVTVVHFRIGTQGTRGLENVHPFMIHDTAMFHNGIFHHEDLKDLTKSDTSMLSELLNELPDGWFYNKAILHLLEGYCGYASKLVFIDAAGDLEILNSKAGDFVDGRWYSNSSYKHTAYKSSYTYPKGNYKGGTTVHGKGNDTIPTMGANSFSAYDDEWGYDDTEFGAWYRGGYKEPEDTVTTEFPYLNSLDVEAKTFKCCSCEQDVDVIDRIDWNGYDVCIDCLELIGEDTLDEILEENEATK